jgi:hypothetical protein
MASRFEQWELRISSLAGTIFVTSCCGLVPEHGPKIKETWRKIICAVYRPEIVKLELGALRVPVGLKYAGGGILQMNG